MNIKTKIALFKILKKNLDKEVKSKYLRFYQSFSNNDIFIFMMKLDWDIEMTFIEEVVREVIEPITGTFLHQFTDKKYLNLNKNYENMMDYSRNLEFGNGKDSYRVVDIEKLLPGIQIPEKIKVREIYNLYELIKQKTNKTNDKMKSF